MISKISKILFLFVIISVSFSALEAQAATCDFTRDLMENDEGEDVRCLQEYLNSSGHTISSSGAGAPGHETDTFRSLTKEAVIRWQAANEISPAQGYFGARSRTKYAELIQSSTVIAPSSGGSPSSAAAELNAQLELLRAKLAKAQSENIQDSSNNEEGAISRIKEALMMMEDAEDQIDDGGNETAQDNLDDAEMDMLDAIRAFFNKKDYAKAFESADDAYKNAEDAFEDAGGETRDDEVENYIDEIWDDIDAAEVEIEAADDDGEDVSKAEDLLDEAMDKLDQAEEELDDENYDEAEDLANDAEDLIDDAVDAIGDNDDKDAAENTIDDAWDAIDDAQDAIDDADDDGDDVDEAEDLLDEARDVIEDAEDEFDDGNYDEAEELAQDAEDLANDANDAL